MANRHTVDVAGRAGVIVSGIIRFGSAIEDGWRRGRGSMGFRRPGVVVFLVLVAAAGCRSGEVAQPAGSGGSPALCGREPVSGITATDELVAAGERLAGERYTFTAEFGSLVTVEGKADGPARGMSGRLDLATSSSVTLVVIDADYYIRYDSLGRADSGQWQHLRLGPGAAMRGGIQMGDPLDPLGSTRLLRAAVSAERSGPCRYTGRLDLARTEGFAAKGKEPVVPFTASVDSLGRLERLRYVLPASDVLPELAVNTTYAAFGAAQEISAPPLTEVREATEAVRQVFHG